jgi:hypothetical protein
MGVTGSRAAALNVILEKLILLQFSQRIRAA